MYYVCYNVYKIYSLKLEIFVFNFLCDDILDSHQKHRQHHQQRST